LTPRHHFFYILAPSHGPSRSLLMTLLQLQLQLLWGFIAVPVADALLAGDPALKKIHFWLGYFFLAVETVEKQALGFR
jgi:hypothetical protein